MANPTRGIVEDILTHDASMPGRVEVEVPGVIDRPDDGGGSGFPDLMELRQILKEVNIAPIEKALTAPTGRRGHRPYPRGPMIRAFLSMPFLGIADISSLRRRLMNDPALRAVCGFTTYVPSRPTLSRVFCQLKELHGLLAKCLSETTQELSEYLPDLGREVAVDSTMVKTNSNTKREPLSDAEATRGKQHSAQESKGWKWVVGYKAHVVADANYDVPLALIVTTGSASDTKYLDPLVEKLQWRPDAVIADRGYDRKHNSEWLYERGIAPVIHKRKPAKKEYHSRGRGKRRKCYSTKGTPLCECGHERPFVGIDPETGERIYDPVGGCVRERELKGFTKCDFEFRVNPEDDIRLFGGAIRRDGPEWETAYRKRWSVERVFSKWKDGNVLVSHSFRGLSSIRLLIMLYALMDSASTLAEARFEEAFPVAA